MPRKVSPVWGLGINDLGVVPRDENGKVAKSYQHWIKIFYRSYSPDHHDKFPTYVGCSVDDRWHTLSNFIEWFDARYVQGWEVDKDVLVPENKVYSPDTCLIIPAHLNTIMSCCRVGNVHPVGIHYRKDRGKWVAQLGRKPKTIHLGSFDNMQDAIDSHIAAKLSYVSEILSEYNLDSISPYVYNTIKHFFKLDAIKFNLEFNYD